MKERGIIQTTEQVQGLLEGSRTVIKVPLKTQPKHATVIEIEKRNGKYKAVPYHRGYHNLWQEEDKIDCPYEVSDMLYVRETYRRFGEDPDPILDEMPINACIDYKANMSKEDLEKEKEYVDEYWDDIYTIPWLSSATMPKKYARIWLEVTSVRVEKDDIWNWVIEVRRVEK